MKKSPIGVFNLPILLSFNELAWVVIFAMGIFASAAYKQVIAARLKEASVSPPKSESPLESQLRSLASSNTELKEANVSMEAEIKRLTEEIDGQRSQALSASTQKIDLQRALEREHNDVIVSQRALQEAQQSLAARDGQVASIKETLGHVNEALAVANRQTERAAGERGLRKELLGLRGQMGNVVIVVDRSFSMIDRWSDTVHVISTWMRLLPVRNCGLVVFSDRADPFPRSLTMLSLEGPAGDENRALLVKQLLQYRPDGGTNTHAALKQAYAFPGVDTIILFTDGEPSLQEGVFLKTHLIDEIFVLADGHRDIPINCVGVGTYYRDRRLTEFLLKLASLTNGVFVGR